MSRVAEHVYTDRAHISQITSLIRELPAKGHVVLLLKDGSSCDGVVISPPNVQIFRDRHEREGINAKVLLERPDVPMWKRNVWLDEVLRVEHLDSMMGES